MTREEAKKRLRKLATQRHDLECVGYCHARDMVALIDEIYDSFDERELELMVDLGGAEIGEVGWRESAEKWRAEAERLNTIVEWLREQCMDSRLI